MFRHYSNHLPIITIDDHWQVSVLASFTCCDDSSPSIEKIADESKAIGLSVDIGDVRESEYHYLSHEDADHDCKGDDCDCNDTWCLARDITISGVTSWQQFKEWSEDIGIYPEDCLTMGSLGGPLGFGCVWDIPFNGEEQDRIDSVRITPFLESEYETILLFNGVFRGESAAMQEAIRQAVFAEYDTRCEDRYAGSRFADDWLIALTGEIDNITDAAMQFARALDFDLTPRAPRNY